MEETPSKRQREEEVEVEAVKRQKSYEDMLSIPEEEEDEHTQDLSSLITTLQQEITCCDESAINDQTQLSSSSSEDDPSEIEPSSFESSSLSPSNRKDEGEGETEKVMRHLLEASDDELGIPSPEEGTVAIDGFGGGSATEIDGGDWLFPVTAAGDGLWEIEDEAANYYTLLQSELFM